MAYYDAFIAAWNSPVQPPANVTGTGLTSTMPTSAKLNFFNAWTETGAVPPSISVLGSDVFNCISWSEFNALSSSQQSNVMAMCQVPGPLLGGSANLSHMTPGMIVAYFPPGGTTITNLTALSKGVTQPWWQFNNYPRPFDMGDVQAAGVS